MKNHIFYTIHHNPHTFDTLVSGILNYCTNKMEFKHSTQYDTDFYMFECVLPTPIKTLCSADSDEIFTLQSHHISFFETLIKIGDNFSAYHFTAIFSSKKSKNTYKLHIYFDESHEILSDFKLFECTIKSREVECRKIPFTESGKTEITNFAWQYISPIITEIANQRDILLNTLEKHYAHKHNAYMNDLWNTQSDDDVVLFQTHRKSFAQEMTRDLEQISCLRKLYKSEIREISHFNKIMSQTFEHSIVEKSTKTKDVTDKITKVSKQVDKSDSAPSNHTVAQEQHYPDSIATQMPTTFPIHQIMLRFTDIGFIKKHRAEILRRPFVHVLMTHPTLSIEQIDWLVHKHKTSPAFSNSLVKYSLREYYLYAAIMHDDLELFKFGLNFIHDYEKPLNFPYCGKQKLTDLLTMTFRCGLFRHLMSVSDISSLMCIGTDSALYKLLTETQNHCRVLYLVANILLGYVDRVMRNKDRLSVRQIHMSRNQFWFFLDQWVYIFKNKFNIIPGNISFSLMNNDVPKDKTISTFGSTFYETMSYVICISNKLLKFRANLGHITPAQEAQAYHVIGILKDTFLKKIFSDFLHIIFTLKDHVVYPKKEFDFCRWRTIYSSYTAALNILCGILELESLDEIEKICLGLKTFTESLHPLRADIAPLKMETILLRMVYIVRFLTEYNKRWCVYAALPPHTRASISFGSATTIQTLLKQLETYQNSNDIIQAEHYITQLSFGSIMGEDNPHTWKLRAK